MIVLLQTGKGTDMGAAFGGGGSQTLFGSGGASTFLSKATTVAAVVFMLTSLFLAYVSTNKSTNSVIPDAPASTPATRTESKPEENASGETQGQTDQPTPVSEDTPNNVVTESGQNDQTTAPKKDTVPSESERNSAENSKETPVQPESQ
jgi:preprotein translocase subunit SecG